MKNHSSLYFWRSLLKYVRKSVVSCGYQSYCDGRHLGLGILTIQRWITRAIHQRRQLAICKSRNYKIWLPII